LTMRTLGAFGSAPRVLCHFADYLQLRLRLCYFVMILQAYSHAPSFCIDCPGAVRSFSGVLVIAAERQPLQLLQVTE